MSKEKGTKRLHAFTVSRQQDVDEVLVTKDEKGQEVKTITKVKKTVPTRFFILKPTRTLFDEADLFYGVKLFEGIQAGLLTRQLLAKRYANDGGSMSEPEKTAYANLYYRMFEKENEYKRLATSKSEGEKTSDDKAKEEEVIKELNSLRDQIQEFELSQITLFDQTAESRARNKTILWWVLFLAYKEVIDEKGEEKSEPVFGQGDFNERIEKYDEMEESEDPFIAEVISKFLYFISFWYMGRATKPEDFAAIEASKQKVDDQIAKEAKEWEEKAKEAEAKTASPEGKLEEKPNEQGKPVQALA